MSWNCHGNVLGVMLSIGLCLVLPPPASAQRLPAVESDHYARCLEQARTNPSGADEDAASWLAAGGGHPAEHCADVALIGLGRYPEAGKRLEMLADAMTKAPIALRAEVLDQAGQAWLLAGDPAKASAILTAALALTPEDGDMLTDRAASYAGEKRYQDAVTDLDHALAQDPQRVDALVYRAAAHRALEQYDPASQDVEAALRLSPGQPDALLERGNIRALKGDTAGARGDWQQILKQSPASPAAKVAQASIAKLDAPPQPAPSPEKKK